MAEEKILVVEDDSEIQEMIGIYLKKERYAVLTASDGYEAVRLVREENPDLVVLDVVLPGLDGFEVCQEIRKSSECPVLFLSAKDGDMDKILGLGIGGDDYITKPFSPGELTARIKAQLRRNRLLNQQTRTNSVFVHKELAIDFTSCTVQVGQVPVNLSAKEFHILSLLIKNPNQVFSLDALYDAIWDMESIGDSRTVMVHISNLRKKIEKDPGSPEYIHTVRGIGYKFVL